jgi:uncharacterized protein YjbJ (UPF0337 family)
MVSVQSNCANEIALVTDDLAVCPEMFASSTTAGEAQHSAFDLGFRPPPCMLPFVCKRTDAIQFQIYALVFNFKDSQMNTDQIKGTVKDVVGKVQQEAGSLVGSVKQEVKGVMLQAEGKAQKHLGDAEQIQKDTRQAIKEAANKRL